MPVLIESRGARPYYDDGGVEDVKKMVSIYVELDGSDDVVKEVFGRETGDTDVYITIASVAGKQRVFWLTGLASEITGVEVARVEGEIDELANRSDETPRVAGGECQFTEATGGMTSRIVPGGPEAAGVVADEEMEQNVENIKRDLVGLAFPEELADDETTVPEDMCGIDEELDDVEQMMVELGKNEIAEDLCVGGNGELIQGCRVCVDDFGCFCAETNEAGPLGEEEEVEMDASCYAVEEKHQQGWRRETCLQCVNKSHFEVDLDFVENGVDEFNAARDAPRASAQTALEASTRESSAEEGNVKSGYMGSWDRELVVSGRGHESGTRVDDAERRRREAATGGRNKRIYVEQGKEIKRMSEEEIVEWMINGGENAFVVHDGKVVTTETVGRLKDNTMIRLVNRLPGGGRKKKTVPKSARGEDLNAMEESSSSTLSSDQSAWMAKANKVFRGDAVEQMKMIASTGPGGWTEAWARKVMEVGEEGEEEILVCLHRAMQEEFGDVVAKKMIKGVRDFVREQMEEAARRKQQREEEEAARRKQQREEEEAARQQQQREEAARQQRQEEEAAQRQRQHEEAETARQQQRQQEEAARRQREQQRQCEETEAVQRQQRQQEEATQRQRKQEEAAWQRQWQQQEAESCQWQGGRGERTKREEQRRREEEEEKRRREEEWQEMEEEKGIQSPMIMKFGKYYGKTCEWVYSRDRDYCDWLVRVEAPNKNLMQFQEFVRAAGRREKWKELEMREKTLEENRRRRELEERKKNKQEEEEKAEAKAKEKPAIEEMREVMTRMRKNIEAPAEVDTMAAAETNTVAAAENGEPTVTVEREQGTKTTEVREEQGWKDDVRWRHTWVKQSEYWNDPKWNKRSSTESRTWCETKDIRQLRPGETVWHVICTSGEEEGEQEREKEEGAVPSPPGIETYHRECEVRRLNDRIRRIEDRIEEWNRGQQGVDHARGEGDSAGWKHDGWRNGGWGGWHQLDGDWAQWDGDWWVKVGRSNLNARQKRRISRDLRRLIAREENEVLSILRELRSAMWKDGGRLSGGESEKTKGGDDDDDGTGSKGGSSRGKSSGQRREVGTGGDEW